MSEMKTTALEMGKSETKQHLLSLPNKSKKNKKVKIQESKTQKS
jgi:hypothetical protein